MTDELEQQVSEMLRDRVADLPALYDVEPSTLLRARRRRATKLGALTTALVLVAAGTAAGVANALARSDNAHSVSAVGEQRAVDTVRCPIDAGLNSDQASVAQQPPRTGPRVPPVGDAATLEHLVSYAAIGGDPRYEVLGPKGWTCKADMAYGGQSGSVLLWPRPAEDHASIFMTTGLLWGGYVGATSACLWANNPAAIEYLQRHRPEAFPCAPERKFTSVDAHVTTFRDPGGSRGAAWIDVPSSETTDDGSLSAVLCVPTTGLLATDCDAVVADWVARVGTESPTTTNPTTSTAPPETTPTTTTTSTTTIPDGAAAGAGCVGTATEPGSVPPRAVAAGDRSLAPGLARFLADLDGSAFFDVLGPRGWVCRMVDPDAGGPIVVFDPAQGSGSGGREAPIQLDFHPLWGDRPDLVAACAVFDDPAIEAYVTRRYPIQCPETSGFAVTRVGSHAATFVVPDGTRGAAWYRLPSSDAAEDGRLFVLSCRPTAGLSPKQCDTITADYAARAEAWVEPR